MVLQIGGCCMVLIRKYVTVAVGMLFGIVILQVRVLCKRCCMTSLSEVPPYTMPAYRRWCILFYGTYDSSCGECNMLRLAVVSVLVCVPKHSYCLSSLSVYLFMTSHVCRLHLFACQFVNGQKLCMKYCGARRWSLEQGSLLSPVISCAVTWHLWEAWCCC